MDFENLKDEFLKVRDDALAFIRCYERNSAGIADLDDSDEEQKSFKLKMNGDYGLYLASTGSTEKAIRFLETYIPRFERESGLSELELLAATYYEHLLWAFGSSLFYVDRVDDTERVFERLVKMQPDNQKYRNWLRSTREKRFSSLRSGLYVSVFVWLFIDILFLESMTSMLKTFFMAGGVIIMGGIAILEAYLFIIRRAVR